MEFLLDMVGWNDEVGLMEVGLIVMDELLDVLVDGSGSGMVKEAPNGAKLLSKSNPCCDCNCGCVFSASDCCCCCC